jgi:hypothetical protein
MRPGISPVERGDDFLQSRGFGLGRLVWHGEFNLSFPPENPKPVSHIPL